MRHARERSRSLALLGMTEDHWWVEEMIFGIAAMVAKSLGAEGPSYRAIKIAAKMVA
jgi:hypothetical protein